MAVKNHPLGPLFKADLHVHSRYSRFPRLRRLGIRCSYSSPVSIYRTAKARGMDLVTITDHNTIDGCLEVRDRLGDPDDFMISEEVESSYPDRPAKIHLNVFDIDEEQHREIQRLRNHFEDLCSYLRQNRILASFNHFIETFAFAVPSEPVLGNLLDRFDLFEVRDGARHSTYNRLMERVLWQARHGGYPKGLVGGSNAHSLRRIGLTYTASRAGSRKEFLEDLRTGATMAFGEDGTLLGMTGDVYQVIGGYYRSLLPGKGDLRVLEKIQGLAVSLCSLPLHLVFLPFFAVRFHFTATRKILLQIQRRLDFLEVTAFRERIQKFPESLAPNRWSGWSGKDAVDPELPST